MIQNKVNNKGDKNNSINQNKNIIANSNDHNDKDFNNRKNEIIKNHCYHEIFNRKVNIIIQNDLKLQVTELKTKKPLHSHLQVCQGIKEESSSEHT